MLKIFNGFDSGQSSDTFRSMLIDRKKVFIDRLRWDLSSTVDGFEVDEYDNSNATYLIICDEYGRHAASLRIIPTLAPTMLFDYFGELSRGIPRSLLTWEVTRFVTSPNSSSLQAAARLMWVGYRFAMRAGVEKILSVTEKRIALQMRACGSRPAKLNTAKYKTETVSLCDWNVDNFNSEKLIRRANLNNSLKKKYSVALSEYQFCQTIEY